MAKKSQFRGAAKDRVDHFVHGTGTVVEVNDRYTTIKFDDAGTRKFMTDMVELSSSDTPAPAKPRPSKKKKATKTSK